MTNVELTVGLEVGMFRCATLCFALCWAVGGCRAGPTEGYPTFVPGHFVDLRAVPADLSGLPQGPHVIEFEAYRPTSLTWDGTERDNLRQRIRVGHVETSQFVKAKVTFTDVPGRADMQHVQVTLSLDGTGTWVADLDAANSTDATERGVNLKNPVGEWLATDFDYHLRGGVFRSVGTCPHISRSTLVSADKATGAAVWRIEWSEPPGPLVANSANLEVMDVQKTADPTAKGMVMKAIALKAADAVHHDVVIPPNAIDLTHGGVIKLAIPEGSSGTARFDSTFSCTPTAGRVVVAEYVDAGYPIATASQHNLWKLALSHVENPGKPPPAPDAGSSAAP